MVCWSMKVDARERVGGWPSSTDWPGTGWFLQKAFPFWAWEQGRKVKDWLKLYIEFILFIQGTQFTFPKKSYQSCNLSQRLWLSRISGQTKGCDFGLAWPMAWSWAMQITTCLTDVQSTLHLLCVISCSFMSLMTTRCHNCLYVLLRHQHPFGICRAQLSAGWDLLPSMLYQMPFYLSSSTMQHQMHHSGFPLIC